MKRVLGLLAILFLLPPAVWGTSLLIYSLREEAFTQRGFRTAPWTYADGSPVKPWERMRVVAVRATNQLADNARYKEELRRVKAGEASVEMDALGNIVPTGFEPCLGFDEDEWEAFDAERTVLPCTEQNSKKDAVPVGFPMLEGAVGTGKSSVSIVVDGKLVSVPDVMVSAWNFVPPQEGSADRWWLFLLVEDTRSGKELTPNASGAARAGSLAAVVMDDCTGEVGDAAPVRLSSNDLPQPINAAYVSAPASPMKATALPTAVTAASGTTYTDPVQIESLFTPEFAAFAQETNGFRLSLAETADGKPQSRLNGEHVPEGLFYSVLTATSLAGPWENLDDVIRKKGLAQDDEKGYTRCQLSDLSGKVLPTFEDKTRFYRVQQTMTSQGE